MFNRSFNYKRCTKGRKVLKLKIMATGRGRNGSAHKLYIFCVSFNRLVHIAMSVCLSICLSVHLPVHLSVHQSIGLSVCLSIYLPDCVSINCNHCKKVKRVKDFIFDLL